jgi:hypothetical protein
LPAKKDFKAQNPALQFIENADPNAPQVSDYPQPDADSSPRAEVKSRRFQLLLRPGTYAALAALAKTRETSVNDTINTILEDYLR